MMLGEESEPAELWHKVGNEAIRRGVKRIVMMVLCRLLEEMPGFMLTDH